MGLPDNVTTRIRLIKLSSAAGRRLPSSISRAVLEGYRRWRCSQEGRPSSGRIPTVLEPAGLEKSIRLISAAWTITPGDPRWDHNPDYQAYRAFHTSPTDYRPIKQFILHRFDGQTWMPIGDIIDVTATS
jgi:hypothetical protein